LTHAEYLSVPDGQDLGRRPVGYKGQRELHAQAKAIIDTFKPQDLVVVSFQAHEDSAFGDALVNIAVRDGDALRRAVRVFRPGDIIDMFFGIALAPAPRGTEVRLAPLYHVPYAEQQEFYAAVEQLKGKVVEGILKSDTSN
jgi:hypothetical protein